MLRSLLIAGALNLGFLVALGEALMRPPRGEPTAAHVLFACVNPRPPRLIGHTWVAEWLQLEWFNIRFNAAQRARYVGDASGFGDGVVGLEEAAAHWFHKDVAALSAGEASFLAALPQSPSLLDPSRHRKNARRLARRMAWVQTSCFVSEAARE